MPIGAQLATARRERNLTFAQVTEQTKIQPWVLEALEADRLPQMMSPIYVKGFLTTYAKFLRMDPEPLIAQIAWPAAPPGIEDSLPPTAPSGPPLSFEIPWPLLSRLGRGLAAVAVVGALIAVNPVRWVSKVPWPHLTSKLAHGSPKGVAQFKSTPRTTVSTAPIPQEPAIKLASIAPVSDSLRPASPASATMTILATQPLEVTVTAHSTTWITVRADGKLVAQQRLSRGAKERWTAKKKLEVIVSKPTQVDLTLNGQPITPFAIAHQGRLLITHQGIVRLPADR